MNVIFIVERGHFELLGRLLCASIRRFPSDGLRLIAAVPHPLHQLSHDTLTVLTECEVEIRQFEPSFHNVGGGRSYLIGNKIDASVAFAGPGRNLLLDTDIVVAAPDWRAVFEDSDELLAARTHGVPLELFEPAKLDEYDSLAARLGLDRGGATMSWPMGDAAPSYNSGVIAYSGPDAAQRWMDLTRDLLRDSSLPLNWRFPYADQIALSLMSIDPSMQFREISEVYNYPYFDAQPSKLIHYHLITRMFRNPQGVEFFEDLVRSYAGTQRLLAREWPIGKLHRGFKEV